MRRMVLIPAVGGICRRSRCGARAAAMAPRQLSSGTSAQEQLSAALSAAKAGTVGRAPVDYVKLDDELAVLRHSANEQDGAIREMAHAVAEDAAQGLLRREQFIAQQGWEEKLLDDYRLLVASVKEKVRLTVHWNDTAKLTEAERVRATANRVGLQTYESPDDK